MALKGMVNIVMSMPNALKWVKLQLPIVIVAVILVLPLLPFVINDQFPMFSDAEIHLHRITSAGESLAEGLYPRWSPHLHHAFGYPVHNFYSTGVYIVGAFLSAMGLSILTAFKLIMMSALILYPLGTYRLARHIASPLGAVVASALYLYAPFRWREILVQVNLPQFVAMAFLPFLLASLITLYKEPTRRHMVNTSIWLALILFTHHLTAFVVMPALILFGLALLFISNRHRIFAILFSGAIVLGLALSAIYWIPALGELDQTQINTIQDDTFTLTNNFTSLDTLLAPPSAIDPNWINWRDATSPIGTRIGWAILGAWLLSIPLSLWQWRKWKPLQRVIALLGFVTVPILIWLITPQSSFIWEQISLAQYIQFPWRLIGLILLAGAPLIALCVDALGNQTRLFVTIALPLIIFALVLPLNHAPVQWYHPPTNPTPQDGFFYERDTGNLGLSASNEYLPIGVETRPLYGIFQGDPPLADRIQNDGWIVDYDERTELPQGATIQTTDLQGGSRYTITTPEPFDLLIHQMAFVGWEARLNGDIVPIEQIAPHGIIGIAIPEGEHDVTLIYAGTSLQHLSAWITVISIIMSIALWVYRPMHTESQMATLSWRWVFAFSIVMVFITVLDRNNAFNALWATYSDDVPAEHPLDISFDTIQLVGYTLTAPKQLGDTATLTLYWQKNAETTRIFGSNITVTTQNGQEVIARASNFLIGGTNSTTWSANGYVIDNHRFILPADSPPFTLEVRVSVLDTRDNSLMMSNDATQRIITTINPVGNYLQFDLDTLADVQFVDEIKLDAWAWQEDNCLAVRWQTINPPILDYAVMLHLVDENGEFLQGADTSPFNGQYPMNKWQVGEVLDDLYCLPDVEGATHVLIALYDRATGQRLEAIQNGDVLSAFAYPIALP